MSSDGFNDNGDSANRAFGRMDPVEYLLFDSLVHHLIEKGLLTKNDALSVIQTVAQVARNYLEDDDTSLKASAALATLKRTYSSFEALPEKSARLAADRENVLQLRPPLHGDQPEFPPGE
jgi:hypothetical protein